MPAFELATLVRDRSPREVFSCLRQLDRMVLSIPGIKITPLGSPAYPLFANHWEIDLEGAPLAWTQANRYLPAKRTVKFEQIEGDFASYQGSWTVAKDEAGARLRWQFEINYGLSNFERLIGAKLAAKTRKLACYFIYNLKNILRQAPVEP